VSNFILKGQLRLNNIQEEGYFCGYASVFDVVDRQKDRVERGAFEKSLRNGDDMPKMLWQHDTKEPIGVWQSIKEDQKGLFVEGQLLMDLRRGREAHTLMKKGVVSGLSIGCQVVSASFCEREKVRTLKELELLEISLVTFAANDKAKVLAVKGHGILNDYQMRLQESIQNAIMTLRSL